MEPVNELLFNARSLTLASNENDCDKVPENCALVILKSIRLISVKRLVGKVPPILVLLSTS